MATKQTKVKRSAPCVVFVDEYDAKNIHFDLPEDRKIQLRHVLQISWYWHQES